MNDLFKDIELDSDYSLSDKIYDTTMDKCLEKILTSYFQKDNISACKYLLHRYKINLYVYKSSVYTRDLFMIFSHTGGNTMTLKVLDSDKQISISLLNDIYTQTGYLITEIIYVSENKWNVKKVAHAISMEDRVIDSELCKHVPRIYKDSLRETSVYLTSINFEDEQDFVNMLNSCKQNYRDIIINTGFVYINGVDLTTALRHRNGISSKLYNLLYNNTYDKFHCSFHNVDDDYPKTYLNNEFEL